MWDLIVSVPNHCLAFYFLEHLVDLPDNILNHKNNASLLECI